MMRTFYETKNKLENKKARSAWDRGVKEYALEILDKIEGYDDIHTPEDLKEKLLKGAKNFKEYSWGGRSLVGNCEIAERLCSPSELKRKDYGRIAPNDKEEWLDVQARALDHAAYLLKNIIFN